VYLQNTWGEGSALRERVMCFDANTGELVWEHGINLYMSDVPPHRVGWASPVADPATGNIYVFTVGGTLAALSPDGELIWERSLAEDFGLVTTHGGRTPSPVIEGDLVIVSGLSSGWGEQARGGQRFFAFHKASGETYWVSSPGGRPYDTTYSPFYAANLNGTRVLIAGGGDGAMHALKPQTGEPVWRFEYSKRGINTGAIVRDGLAIVSHSEENLETNEMGLVAAIDATARGEIESSSARWSVGGFLGGFSSPVLDGDRFYQVDNSANLTAFDFASGRELWKLNLGTIQRASPVLADGKLYVGTVNGTFYIIQPTATEGRILDEDALSSGEEFEEIYASAAVSDGRIYLVSSHAMYAIGTNERTASSRASTAATMSAAASGEPAYVQVAPTELVLAPGDSVELSARLFDDTGRLIRDASSEEATWTLEGLEGTVSEGRFTVSSNSGGAAGKITASISELSGSARARVIAPLPWTYDFEQMDTVPPEWINATGKFEIREIDGNKVLVKKADNPFLRRARVYMGPSDWSNHTVQADVMATLARRQKGNVGVVAQRYQLTLLGNHQRIELQSWQPETERTARMPYPWDPDTWYRMKLEVFRAEDGSVVARGKVWQRDEAEPSEWMIERRDEFPNLVGSPGIFADAQPTEVFLDNIEVRTNQ
jgi:outer membrane protein assembly factor BamB